VWLRARERWTPSVGDGQDAVGTEADDLAGPLSGAEDRVLVRFS
jgi:hypothetical protein